MPPSPETARNRAPPDDSRRGAVGECSKGRHGRVGAIGRGLVMTTGTEAFVEAAEQAAHPAARAFRRIRLLVASYAALSVLTLAAIIALRHHSGVVNSAVWTRGVIVVLSALLTLRFTAQAARGARRAFLRLRIISAVMVVAIVVIVALPGTFPLWMKVEQSICGVLLVGVAALVNGRQLRSLAASR
jgi:hypothetical protein